MLKLTHFTGAQGRSLPKRMPNFRRYPFPKPVIYDLVGISLVFFLLLPVYWIDVLHFFPPANQLLAGLSIYQDPYYYSSYYPFFTLLQALFVLPFKLAGLSQPAAGFSPVLRLWEVLPVKLLLLTAHLASYAMLIRLSGGWRPAIRWLFLFNPLILLVSFGLGQTDETVAPFLLGALFLASRPPRPATDYGMGVLLGLAASLKIWPLMIIPFLLVWSGSWPRVGRIFLGFLTAGLVNLAYFAVFPQDLSVPFSTLPGIGLRYAWPLRGTNPLFIHPFLKQLYSLPFFTYLLWLALSLVPLRWRGQITLLEALTFLAGTTTLLAPEAADFRFIPFLTLLALRASTTAGNPWDRRLSGIYTTLSSLVVLAVIGYFWLFRPLLTTTFTSPLNQPLATQELAQKLYPYLEQARAWIGVVYLAGILAWSQAVITNATKQSSGNGATL